MGGSVTVDVDIDEFSDEDIVDEVVARKLVDEAIAQRARESGVAPAAQAKPVSTKEMAEDAMAWLMRRRQAEAIEQVRALIEAFVPPAVLAAYEAAKAGRLNDAICDLDRFIQPATSATETSLPKPWTPQERMQ